MSRARTEAGEKSPMDRKSPAKLLPITASNDDTVLMDIAAASMSLAQTKIADQVGTAMLSKGLKTEQEQGSQLMQMLGTSAPLAEGSGQKVDLLA